MINHYSPYSQYDEDSILSECLEKIRTKSSLSKTFLEVGCGNGLENNSHTLLLQGYKGVWVDSDEKNIRFIASQLGGEQFENLLVLKFSVRAENAETLATKTQKFLGIDSIDILSIDIDGNDYHIAPKLIKILAPKVLCVEYNAKFPPPIEMVMEYNPSHVWNHDDYYGASIQAWANLLETSGYRLVHCSSSGVNAFFVQLDYEELFDRRSIDSIYRAPNYKIISEKVGNSHPPSLRWLRQVLIP
jgi:hypothetical protein